MRLHPSFLLKNNHNGTFTDIGLESGVALNEDGMEQAGMGIGIGDYNLDGNLDIFKTHFADDTNILYRNDSKGNFEDVTIRAGLGVETRYISWGAGIVDLDNDGLPDLFLVTGNVYPEVEAKLPVIRCARRALCSARSAAGSSRLIDQAGPGVATPTPVAAGLRRFRQRRRYRHSHRQYEEPPSLLRNDMSGNNHWLKVKLIGVKSNRSAIGARVVARYGGKMQAQEVMSQSSFYSASDLRLHFGLGAVTTVDLEIRWPNGDKEVVSKIAADHLVVIKEGSGVIKTEAFKKSTAATPLAARLKPAK